MFSEYRRVLILPKDSKYDFQSTSQVLKWLDQSIFFYKNCK